MSVAVQDAAVFNMSTGKSSDSAAADQKLRRRVRLALTRTGYAALTRAEVTVENGRVYLTGHVPNYYNRQVATATVLKVDGVAGLTNNLKVSPNG